MFPVKNFFKKILLFCSQWCIIVHEVIFLERIMLARKRLKWTQEQLAEAIGVKRAIISKYENGSVEPSITQIRKIAKALNTSTAYLLGDIDDPDDKSWWVSAVDMAFNEIAEDNTWKEAVKFAEKEHLNALYSICEGDSNYKSVTKLYNREFLATRINMVTEFILRNKEFLQMNMPGIEIINDKKKSNTEE